MFNSSYNPDVLSCIANLSSDEVFTPPQLANQTLDLSEELGVTRTQVLIQVANQVCFFVRSLNASIKGWKQILIVRND